jgi:hypothetical protein
MEIQIAKHIAYTLENQQYKSVYHAEKQRNEVNDIEDVPFKQRHHSCPSVQLGF